MSGFREGSIGAALLSLSVMAAASQADVRGQSAVTPPNNAPITVAGCVVREDDYARGSRRPPAGDPNAASSSQLLLATAGTGAAEYSLVGTRESELAKHVGRRVEIIGTLEPPRVAAAPTTADGSPAARGTAGRGTAAAGLPPAGATGVTPSGSPSHEPGDAAPGTVSTGVGNGAPAGATRDAAVSLATIPRMNVTSFRTVEGPCTKPPANQASAPTPPSSTAEKVAAARPSTGPPQVQPVTALGCLVRQTASGDARTTQGGSIVEEIVLTNASLSSARSGPVVSAVPGSLPSGSGSGTVETSTSATRTVPADARERAFVLTANGTSEFSRLAAHVGQRVEIVGVLDESAAADRDLQSAAGVPATRGNVGSGGRAETATSSAHPSAPVQRLAVTSFRAVGGTCN